MEVSGQEPAAAEEPAPSPSAVDAEREQWAAEKAELQDRLLRTQAEFQNFRRRVDKERSEFLSYASAEAVGALLPVLDDFERALKMEAPGPKASREEASGEYVKGIELIYQRLYEALKKLGLEPIVSTGQPFDPNIHHAVEMVETEEAADHTVLDEFQRGYNFKGRLLRPAMVKVAVAPAQST